MSFEIVSTNELRTTLPLSEVIPMLRTSFDRLGKVSSSTDAFLEGKIRFGLQSVKVRVSWVSESGSTRIVIQGSSDDIWNAGGKNVTKRLIEAIRNYNNPGYKVSRLGMHPGALFGLVCGFVIIIIVLMKWINHFIL